MRLSNSAKAILLMVNHIVASHIPPIPLMIRLPGDDVDTTSSTYDAGLAPRLAPDNIWAYKDGCNSCKSRCPQGQIVDQKDCTKCVSCPSGQKPDRTGRQCIEDKREKKKRGWERTLPKKMREYKFKVGFDKWRGIKDGEYHDKRDEEKRRKVRRMSRCLALVPLAMGSSGVEEYDELFDEDWTDNMAMMEFWPDYLEIDGWESDEDDELWEEDSYVDQWVNVGNDVEKRAAPTNRTVSDGFPRRTSRRDVRSSTSRFTRLERVPRKARGHGHGHVVDAKNSTAMSTKELSVRDESSHVQKRCPICWLIPIFVALLRTVTAVVRVGAAVARGAVRVVRGRNGRSKREQREGADKLSRDKNWKRCLMGMSPL